MVQIISSPETYIMGQFPWPDERYFMGRCLKSTFQLRKNFRLCWCGAKFEKSIRSCMTCRSYYQVLRILPVNKVFNSQTQPNRSWELRKSVMESYGAKESSKAVQAWANFWPQRGKKKEIVKQCVSSKYYYMYYENSLWINIRFTYFLMQSPRL